MADKLYEALCKNAELSQKFMEASSKGEAFAVIKDIIPGYTMDEMISELEERQGSSSNVSDDELEAVAGGFFMDDDIGLPVENEFRYVSVKDFYETIFRTGKWMAQ